MNLVVEEQKSGLLSLFEGAMTPSDNAKLRSSAQSALALAEFPTRKTEEWKYTRVNAIKNGEFVLAGKHNLTSIPKDWVLANSITVIIENGHFRSDLLDERHIDGLTISAGNEDEMIGHVAPTTSKDIFTCLNSAYHQGVLSLRIESNRHIEEAIHIICVNTTDRVLAQPRIAVTSLAGSKAHVFLSTKNDCQGSFTNSVIEASVAQNAFLSIDQLQQQEEQMMVNSIFATQEDGSTFSTSACTISGQLIRNNLHIESNGENCHSQLCGIYVPVENEHVDNHTTVRHLKPHSTSDELYKGAMFDQSTGVFNGRVYVDQLAQKTNAFQSNANILLSDDASVNSKPELEIYADDVKCSHGTTTGQLDEEALFYLRSRGLSKDSAKRLLLTAMMADVLERVQPGEFRDRVERLLGDKLNAHA